MGINHLTQAEAILQKDPKKNAYPLLRIDQGMVSECEVLGESVRLLDSENGKYLYSVDTWEAFKVLYAPVRNRRGSHVSLVTDDRFTEAIAQHDGTLRLNAFHQLLAATNLPIQPIAGITFAKIDEAAIGWMLSVYQHPELNHDFVVRRCANAPSVLALYHGAPVGFIMSHCDAELGPVYVDPQFRASGLATQLFARIMEQFTARGARPVVFVSLYNTRSLKWLLRIGCTLANDKVLWFWRDI